MSQAGKVLHLYVEVRSVAEEEGKVPGRGGADGSGHLMLQCPDVLPHSQRSSTHSSPSCSPAVSPVHQLHAGCSNHSLAPSKSSSRHSVSFQLQNPTAAGSPVHLHQQDVLSDSFGQLLQVLAPVSSPVQHGSLGCNRSPDMDPYQGRVPVSPSSTCSGRLSVPCTPTCNRRSCEIPGLGGEEGRTSVVTFGYIEKANVHSMGSRRTSVCQTDLDNPLSRADGQPAHLRKRLSDPAWYSGRPAQGDPHPHHLSPRGSPYLQRAAMDAVARDATHRALEEFGSPELRRRFAGHGSENCSPTLPRYHQPPRCRSWGGSPVLPRGTLTLPSKAQLLELDRGICRSSVNGIPRSPASDHLCAHMRYPSHPMAPASALHSHGPPPGQQRPRVGDEGSKFSSKFHPPLPAGRPTDIQHEIPTSRSPTSTQPRTGFQTSGNSQHSVNSCKATIINTSHNANDNANSRNHCKPLRCSSRASDQSAGSGRRSVSPSSNPELACQLAVEATKLSSIFAGRRTPSPTPPQAESVLSQSPKMAASLLKGRSSPEHLQADTQTHNHRRTTDKPVPQTRPGRVSPLLSQSALSSPASPAAPARLHRAAASQSPVLDPRQQRMSFSKDTSHLHRYQPPQYTGDHRPAVDRRDYDQLDSPEVCRRILSSQNTEASPVSWTSRQQEWRETRPVQDQDGHTQSTCRVYAPSKDGLDAGVKMSEQGNHRCGVDVLEVQDHSGAAGTSSQSSSGVTGSVGDTSPLDRQETSSQSSHDTMDTGSGLQVGWMGG